VIPDTFPGMEPWRTAIVNARDGEIWIRGRNVTSLMRESSFTDTIFLLHRGRLPDARERRLLDAILSASCDHGSGAPSCATARLAASGNRQSYSAAVAAGVLAIGNEHGGAGEQCMQLIASGVTRAKDRGISIEAAAAEVVTETRTGGRRLPGLGHRVHRIDPRVEVLFDLAREDGQDGDGVRFVIALQQAAAAAIKPLPINIDGALAALLYDLGFPPEAGKLLFIIARVAGLTAEVAEEYNREKPMRIRIPVEYDGVPPAQES
jgi:citrate synthase